MKTFLEIQPKLWQSLYPLFRDNVNSSTSSEVISKISTVLQQYGFVPDTADLTAAQLFAMLYDRVATTTTPLYYEEDTDASAFLSFNDIYEINYKLASEQDPRIARLLLALTVFARTYPHPSNWIRFVRRDIFYLAGLSKLSTREQDILTSRLHTQYGFDMQVVGSTQPTPCFRINWLSPITDDNPLINIGRFLPDTIKEYSKKLAVNQ